jgi:UDP-galactopyranose mutase
MNDRHAASSVQAEQEGSPSGDGPLPLICLSHLRWRFVFQRPQHLMTRFARERRVYFVEEPIRDGDDARLALEADATGVVVATPHLPAGLPDEAVTQAIATLVGGLAADVGAGGYVLWFLTPMALEYARGLRPAAVVYDCMDDLSSFAFASPMLPALEDELLARADVVFTGGRSLFEARRDRHPNAHCCPSSVDVAHFATARRPPREPVDQQSIPSPRIGYAGVIDERMDLDLLAGVADLRPDWHLVLIGPIAKIDSASIPAGANVHRLGAKPYAELPAYLAHWQVGMLPFARNEATRFISPTKTPEYLAAGLPVVSTSIRDVVTPYGDLGLVRIADTPAAFVAAIEDLLQSDATMRHTRADAFLATQSWDLTWRFMRDEVDAVVGRVTPAPHRGMAAVPSSVITPSPSRLELGS